MAMDDSESCGSRQMEASSSPKKTRQERQRLEVFNEVLNRLHELDCDEVKLPGFEDELWQHFNRLPARFLNLKPFIIGAFNSVIFFSS